MTREQQRRGALEALDRILNRGGDADDVLRDVVAALAPLYESVALDCLEDAGIVAGPTHGGASPPASATAWPVRFGDREVALLRVTPEREDDREFLLRVTTLIAAYCLVGWDTRGEPWEP